MKIDRIIELVERHAWLVIATACGAAMFLSYVSFGWDEGGELTGRQFPVSGPWRVVMIAGAWLAFKICVGSMLLAVAVEARRMRALRESLRWWHHEPPAGSEPSTSEPIFKLSTCSRLDKGHRCNESCRLG